MTPRCRGVENGGAVRIRIHKMNNARYMSPSVSTTILIALLLFTSAALAQVGYGPNFDHCGDNCQTALLHFCTQLRDAQQQSDCWCGVEDLNRQYMEKMDACLATCDPDVSQRDVQRDMILRYRQVVCKESAKDDDDFQAYYDERYGIAFTPKATAAAPPPPPAMNIKPSSNRRIQTATSATAPPFKTTTATQDATSSTILSASTPTPVASGSGSPFPAAINASASDSSRPILDTAEITGVCLGATAALVGLIGLVLLLRRRKRQHERKSRRFSISPASHDDYIWSPLSPSFEKSHTPDSFESIKQQRALRVKGSIRDFLGWKLQPSGLDIDPKFTSDTKSGSNHSHTGSTATHERTDVPKIRVVSPSGSNRPMEISPPILMSKANATGGGVFSQQPRQGPLPPPPRQFHRPSPQPQFCVFPPKARYTPSIATSASGPPSTIKERPDFILPPFPAPPNRLPPHAVTTPTGMPPDFGLFVHPYTHVHDPTRLSTMSHCTDMDMGRMSIMSYGGSVCSQQSDVCYDDAASEWTDCVDCRTEGAETLERRAKLDELFLAVEAGYRNTTYTEDYGDAFEKEMGMRVGGKTNMSRKTSVSQRRGRRLF
ncbi:hypothetical protein EX30DRAFT_234361 [Ascodesmis nigricans]|uniref:Extracellular membrane protein CFEM domain-containing protein n=1 Tax=Ascodesmis nigricans TaxID=341454 RepID=A0A4S2MZ35_9PEZI|nr:hypothetical protein EX30DRAFT_234361 [Ascodesmis nigricans]